MGHARGHARCSTSRRAVCADDPRRRIAGRPERVDLVRRAGAARARRDARDPGRERARGLARPRGRIGERRDRLALGDPQDGEADGPVPARHRLRHLRLLGDAAARQHLRRRQLRRGRPRRVADHAARTGRWTAESSRSASRRCSRFGERAARAVQAVFYGVRIPGDHRRGGRGGDATATRARDAAGPRSRRRRRRGRPRCSRIASPASTSPSRSTAAGFADVAEARARHAAPADLGGLPADLGDHRRRTGRCEAAAVNDPNELRRTGDRLPASRASAGRSSSSLPHELDPPARSPTQAPTAPAAARRARRQAGRGDSPRRGRRRRQARRSGTVCARRSTASGTRRCCAAVVAGVARGAAREPRLVRVRRSQRRRLHRPRRRPASPAPGVAIGLQSKGTGGHPPRRPAAARQPRAVRDGAAADARLLPRDRPQCRALRHSAEPVGPVPHGARQLRAREADRDDDAAARS